YVEMLEQQQLQLTVGLQKLYKRAIDKQAWPGQPLEVTSNGHPLIHHILEGLDAIHIQGANTPDHFEEDFEVMQRRLVANGALPINRQSSEESESSEGTATIPDVVSPYVPNRQMPFFPSPPSPQRPQPPPPPGNMLPYYSNQPLSFPYSHGPLFQENLMYDQTPSNGPMSSPTDYAHTNPCLPVFNFVDEEGRGGGFSHVDMTRPYSLSQDQRP
ncbi:MAG: hypothetical protein Q9212_006344, partial [Teloschistes hypoglaucus]